jgi:hypothetical protein
MREDDDIPLLTDLVQPLANSFNVTTELVAEIAEKIRPQVAAEIEKSVVQKLKLEMRQELLDHLLTESANIQKANQAYISSALNQQQDEHSALIIKQQSNAEASLKQYVADSLAAVQQQALDDTVAFVGKARADLATEIPRLMHTNADIIKTDLQNNLSQMQAQAASELNEKFTASLPGLQQELAERLQLTLAELEKVSVDNAVQALQEKTSQLRESIFADQKANLAQELAAIYKALTQHTQTELSVYLDSLQTESQQELEKQLGDTFPALYQNLSNELTATLKTDFTALAENTKKDFIQGLSADLPSVEQALANKVHEILDVEVTRIEQTMTTSIKAEIEKMVDSVRLVFPK